MAYQRQPFTTAQGFICTRPFVMNGVSYGYDQRVDTAGIEVRRLRHMYDARMIDVDDGSRQKLDAPAAPPPRVDTDEAPAAPGVPSMKHKGFGKFEVIDAAGNVVAGPLSKDEAEKALAKLQ
ncbi:hypothetical protein UFOVP119_76 [uncultured Caudovirales phage]|uniref:Uncharacterized protein n=1 Tax=uncultured Caudovirales phage TaxID=2100421 RepID=A0A6J5LAK7_9CAUD|nr:hypothetical protein UFOVP119_76 [uncultured Caudovirales phage]